MQNTPIPARTRLDCLKTAIRGTFPCQRITQTERWLGHVSHEVKNPLTVVLTNASLIKRMSSDAHVSRFADGIVENSRRIEQILNDLLDVSRVEAGTFTVDKLSVDAHELVSKVLSAQSVLAQKSVNLHGSATGTVLCDAARITQVLTNLVSNAAKFTTQGEIEVLGEDLGDVYRFSVRDTGRGMSKEETERVFDRFWQADTTQKKMGSGLGMTISRSIVESHCGDIWVESELNKGTTFFVELPQLVAANTATQ